mmetsp:Transcript_6541/g.9170  ORF Transcript_6541/g.9170 Transcript_6541/m.9170 type:complete len:401 (+) Transcript_6541:69-1271(+)|eukprot:CAMPEP_0171473690 /NCGR_PEP_ID=MMETSP0946-20130122/1985_1 /TAXON_ID=109269 /ORGANISM="Vaucheria litorea, Strain CCMP2940" /LENGTH=400 /DNA_ID=CAMNT_0012003489 /DNA_START=103 /DNA_END=1305 /DNA_ORIENTATION=+
MGDVADMLGVAKDEAAVDPLTAAIGGTKKIGEKKPTKPIGMSREVYNLIGTKGEIPSTFPACPIDLKNKEKVKWEWVEFTNPLRKDKAKFFHWVRSSAEQEEYPYEKLDAKTPLIKFTDQEYSNVLKTFNWSRRETEQLLSLVSKYDLCWPVIFDRFESESGQEKPMEVIQQRFYSIVEKLESHRKKCAANTANLSEWFGKSSYNIEYEKSRRKMLENEFHRDGEAEREAEAIRNEIKKIMKKSGLKKGGNDAFARFTNEMKIHKDTLEHSQNKALPFNPIDNPYTQSQRIELEKNNSSFGKFFTKKIQTILEELSIPSNLKASQEVCDNMDALKTDIVELLSLQKVVQKLEQEYASHIQNNHGAPSVDGMSDSSFGNADTNKKGLNSSQGSVGKAKRRK